MKKKQNEDMAGLVELIANEVVKMAKSEADGGSKLSKADPGEESPGEKPPEGSSIEGTKGPEESAPGAEASPTPDASPPPDASAEPSEGAGTATGDVAADASAGLDPEAIMKEIAGLSFEEKKMYLLAFKQAVAEDPQAMGMAPDASGDAEASVPPEASAPPTASAPPVPQSAPPIGKGEMDDKSGKVSAGSMAKSESLLKSENDLLKAQLDASEKARTEQQSQLEKVVAGFKSLVERRPTIRKSLTFVNKPGNEPAAKGAVEFAGLNRDQKIRKLVEVTASPDLKKADRDLINRWTIGQEPDDKILRFFE